MKKVAVKRKGKESVSVSATVEPIDYDKLAEAILEGSIKRGTNVVVGMTKQGITFTTK